MVRLALFPTAAVVCWSSYTWLRLLLCSSRESQPVDSLDLVLLLKKYKFQLIFHSQHFYSASIAATAFSAL